MKRSYDEVINELKRRISDGMYVMNIHNRDSLTVIVPHKEVNILKDVTITHHIGDTEEIKVMGLNCVPADVDRIYVCLE